MTAANAGNAEAPAQGPAPAADPPAQSRWDARRVLSTLGIIGGLVVLVGIGLSLFSKPAPTIPVQQSVQQTQPVQPPQAPAPQAAPTPQAAQSLPAPAPAPTPVQPAPVIGHTRPVPQVRPSAPAPVVQPPPQPQPLIVYVAPAPVNVQVNVDRPAGGHCVYGGARSTNWEGFWSMGRSPYYPQGYYGSGPATYDEYVSRQAWDRYWGGGRR